MSLPTRFSTTVAALVAPWLAGVLHAASVPFPDQGLEIDMPEGYTEQGRRVAAGTNVLTFGHPDANAPVITLSLIPLETGFAGPGEVFESQAGAVEAVLGGTAEVRELNDFELGHAPARWGWLERTGDDGSRRVGLGVVEFDDVQVAFSALMSADVADRWAEPVKRAFLSVRALGGPVAEVTGLRPATRGGVETLAPPSTFEHPLFTVDLPAGWSAAINAREARAINLAQLTGPTGSITVLCLTGLGASRRTMDDATRGSLANNLPNLQRVSSDSVKVANGRKASVNVFQGRTEAQGTTVVLDGLTASVKCRKCWLGFIGVGPGGDHGERLSEMLEIVRSVR